MAKIDLTDRHIAVAGIVLARITKPTITKEEWKEIADKANVTDGDVVRNAQYAWKQFLAKITTEGGEGAAAGGAGKDVAKGKKRKGVASTENGGEEDDDDDDEETKAEVVKKSAAKKGTAKGKGKGAAKKVKVEHEEDEAQD